MASLLPCTSGECISTARRRLGHTYEVSDGLSACMQRLANSLHDRKRLQVDPVRVGSARGECPRSPAPSQTQIKPCPMRPTWPHL